jgi:hypothetical protein
MSPEHDPRLRRLQTLSELPDGSFPQADSTAC